VITQFKSIIRVGKFACFNNTSGNQHELKEKTIIFGRNTRGKSTLAAIIKSLSEDKPDYILGRKTFGEIANQKVVIKENGATGSVTHMFEDGAWASSMPYIRVFDAKYVRQNVHTEEAVLNDQQVKLEALILGPQGESLRQKMEDSDRLCKDNSDRKTALTNEYNRYLKTQTNLDFQEFIKLKPDDDIQAKVGSQKDTITTYKKYDDIKKTIADIDQLLDNWDFTNISEKLSPDIEISQQIIRDHIDRNLAKKETARDFLQAGFDQIKQNGVCPFCSQDISSGVAKGLVLEFSTLFSDSYRSLGRALQETEAEMGTFSPKRELEAKTEKLTGLGEEFDLSLIIKQIIESQKLVVGEIRKKKDDYSHSFDKTVIDSLAESINSVSSALADLRMKYAYDFNEANLDKLNDALREFEIIKERSSQRWMDNCSEYEDLISKTQGLSDARSAALQGKNEYAKTVFTIYGNEINTVLTSLNAQFKLIDLQPRGTIRGRQPLYAIEFNGGYQVAITPESESEAGFDNTLSESDKRLLGFAFFLAEISLDLNKNKLIIVLDDPMSSFDTERKQATAKLLNSLVVDIDQVIVLTHEEGFLKTLHKCFDDSALLKITSRENTSFIEAMDINDEYLDKHYKDVMLLEKIASGQVEAAPDDLRCMRDITEEIMTRKYYTILKDDRANGKSISSFVSTLKNAGIYTDDALNGEINGLYLHFWNHDDSAKPIAREDFSSGDLQAFAVDFLKVLHKL
jgi:wobble nucleotide-excising tRNase